MSRVIKFRAWNDKEKVLYVPEYISNDPSEVLEPIMQFTGLIDKNGKEIYEGDILRTFDQQIESVGWDDVDASFSFSGSLPMNYHDQCEVIGNIYENPELLKP